MEAAAAASAAAAAASVVERRVVVVVNDWEKRKFLKCLYLLCTTARKWENKYFVKRLVRGGRIPTLELISPYIIPLSTPFSFIRRRLCLTFRLGVKDGKSNLSHFFCKLAETEYIRFLPPHVCVKGKNIWRDSPSQVSPIHGQKKN